MELDEAVTEATKQRKDEHKEFVQTAAENNAALQLLEVAKNRLNKFYNPALSAFRFWPSISMVEIEIIYPNFALVLIQAQSHHPRFALNGHMCDSVDF